METENLTLRILEQIQTTLTAFAARFDALETRFGTLEAKMDQRFEAVNRRFDQTNRQMLAIEARLSTEISALRASVLELELRQSPV